MEPVVYVKDLRKIYDLGGTKVTALAGVEVAIQSGEFVAVMGPSGSGKSTFMHILGLLDEPSSGLYRFEGQDASSLNADERADIRSRRLGFVFQAYNLLARTSAIDNVELPMLYAHVPAQERRRIALDKLQVVGIEQLAEHLPNQMSGGQQQRVALARALVNRPRVLLLDEPLSALDLKLRQQMQVELRAIKRRIGQTFIFVTHDQE